MTGMPPGDEVLALGVGHTADSREFCYHSAQKRVNWKDVLVA